METAFYILMIYYTGFILALGIAMRNIKKFKTKDSPWFAALLSWVFILFILIARTVNAIDFAVFRWKFNRPYRGKRKEALKAILSIRSITGDAKELPLYQLLFCWIKMFICLLSYRVYGNITDNGKMCILTWNERHGYESTSWDSVWVSPYFFRDWSVCLYSDGC